MAGFHWQHADRRRLLPAVVEAYMRAIKHEWQVDESKISTGTRLADLRALMVGTAFTMAALSTKEKEIKSRELRGDTELPPPSGWPVEITLPDFTTNDYSSEERKLAAALLSGTWGLLATSAVGPPSKDRPLLTDYRTIDDSNAVQFSTGILPALIIAGVIIVAAVAVAAQAMTIIYVSQIAGDVIDRELARSEDSRRMLAYHAESMKLLAMHSDKEKEAGKELPLTEAKRAVLRNLGNVQTEIAKKKELPMPRTKLPPIPGIFDITTIGFIVAGIAAAVLFFRK